MSGLRRDLQVRKAGARNVLLLRIYIEGVDAWVQIGRQVMSHRTAPRLGCGAGVAGGRGSWGCA